MVLSDPKGWTSDVAALDLQKAWDASPTSWRSVLADMFGIDSATPLLVSTEPDMTYIINGRAKTDVAGGPDAFFVFNKMEWTAKRVLSPVAKEDIWKALDSKGLQGLQVAELKPLMEEP